MSRPKKFSKTNTDEWKARGFKSTTKSEVNTSPADTNSTSAVQTSVPPRLQKVNTKPPQRISASGKIQKKTPGKPGFIKNKKNKLQTKKQTDASEEPTANITPDTDIAKGIEPDQTKSPSKNLSKKVKKNDTNTVPGEEGGEQAKDTNTKRKKQKFQGYTLFIGNLAYETTKEDLLSHFSKCGPIKAVRLPVEKETNKPRGFAYLEVDDHVTYEKVLSLHHSFMKKRRINVECTFGGSNSSQKRKALIKEKTLKLRFLSREGKISSAKKRPWGKFVKADGKGNDEK